MCMSAKLMKPQECDDNEEFKTEHFHVDPTTMLRYFFTGCFHHQLFRSKMGKSQSKISKEDMDFLQQKTDLDKSTIEVSLKNSLLNTNSGSPEKKLRLGIMMVFLIRNGTRVS